MLHKRRLCATLAIFLIASALVKARVFFGPYPQYREWVANRLSVDPARYDHFLALTLVALVGAWIVVRRQRSNVPGTHDNTRSNRIVRTIRELGMLGSVPRAILFAVVATLPLLTVGLIFGGQLSFKHTLLIAAVIAPLAEEIFFRGWAFGQLVRRAGLSFWPAAIITAVVFGLMHVKPQTYAGLSFTTNDAITVAVTSAGGAFYAWLFVKWNWNLWVPIALHAMMNLWWDVFSEVGIGGVHANIARALTIATAVLLTVFAHRIPLLRAGVTSRSERT